MFSFEDQSIHFVTAYKNHTKVKCEEEEMGERWQAHSVKRSETYFRVGMYFDRVHTNTVPWSYDPLP